MLGRRGDLCTWSLQFSWGEDTHAIITDERGEGEVQEARETGSSMRGQWWGWGGLVYKRRNIVQRLQEGQLRASTEPPTGEMKAGEAGRSQVGPCWPHKEHWF